MNNKDFYRSYCKENQTLLFFSPFWLDATAPGWDVSLSFNNDGSLAAALPYFKKKNNLIFSGLTLPYFTPYLGPLFMPNLDTDSYYKSNSFISKHLKNLISQFPNCTYLDINFSPEFNQPQSLFPHFNITTRYTQVIRHLQSQPLNLGLNVRQRIKKFKGKYKVISTEEDALFINQLEAFYKRKGLHYQISKLSSMKSILKRAKFENFGKMLSLTENDKVSCTAFLAYDKETAYLIAYSTTEKASKSGIISPFIYECIQFAKQKGLNNFDFCGSMIPGVEMMNRSFGTIHVPYLNINKSNKLVRILRNI